MVRLGWSFVFAFGFLAAYLSVTLAVFSTNNLKSSSMAGPPPIYKTNTLSQIAINNILTCVLLLSLLLLLLLVLPLGVDATTQWCVWIFSSVWGLFGTIIEKPQNVWFPFVCCWPTWELALRRRSSDFQGELYWPQQCINNDRHPVSNRKEQRERKERS